MTARPGLIIDLFAGAGGASLGIEAAMGRPIDIAINHDPIALAVHAANHPLTFHITSDIFEVKPREVTKGRRVALLWASPDCTHFSVAKGGKPRKQNIRSLAWTVVLWAHDVAPDVICLENVQEFLSWGPLDAEGKPAKKEMGTTFKKWKRSLEKLGYMVEYRVLRASDYGAPTSRKRLFIIARRDGLPITWPTPTHGGSGLLPVRAAAECIDWSIPCPSIFGRTYKDGRPKNLVKATQQRIAMGIKQFVIGASSPFIVPNGDQLTAPILIQRSYGEREGQRPRYLDLHQPLGTVVAGGIKHALVTAFLTKNYKGVIGVPIDGRPLDTITTVDHHSVVMAFLTAYYSSDGDKGQSLFDPARTITTKDRLGLVTVQGTQYRIDDIGMRMLEPHELLRAQFGGFASRYNLSLAKTKTAKVRLIGNSVCPEVAEAVIASNFSHLQRLEAAE
jgi:DNA (cytosine-5)-methyltransferase 1